MSPPLGKVTKVSRRTPSILATTVVARVFAPARAGGYPRVPAICRPSGNTIKSGPPNRTLTALPVMMTLLFINVGLGFVARAAPSLNIFTVGFPALILTGFVVMMVSMGNNVARIDWVWTQAFMMLRSYLGG